MKPEAWEFLRKYYSAEEIAYDQIRKEELNNKDILVEFDKNYENVLKEDNLDDILSILREKKRLI